MKSYIWSIAFHGAASWTLIKLEHKYLNSFEMWRCRRMQEISWAHVFRNEEILRRIKEQRNFEGCLTVHLHHEMK